MARLKRSGHRSGEAPAGSRLVALARDLQRRRGRERRALFIAEGVRAVEEAVRARVTLRGVLIAPQLEESGRGRSLLRAIEQRTTEVVRLPQRDLAAISGTETPQGILAIGEVPSGALRDVRLTSDSRVLVLDGVQDPGNVGTMVRTAAAFGAAAVVALPGTVDLWNPKVVRGAMGAHFQIPAFHCELDEFVLWLDAEHVELWIAESAGEQLAGVYVPARVAVAVGNEGAGVSARLRESASRHVSIPIDSRVESLNVAVAAGIVLYALRPAREG